jgi:DNA transformation protein
MPPSNQFASYIKDLLEPFGVDKMRAMFGGYGLYKGGLMIALIAENELYFKAGPDEARIFEAAGSEPFTYDAGDKKVKMSYFKVLQEVIEDDEMLEKWMNLAYGAAIKAAKKKQK